MIRLSSKRTRWYKRGGQGLQFGALVLIVNIASAIFVRGGLPMPIELLIPFITIAYLVSRWNAQDLIDEVLLDTNEVIVRNRGAEVRLPMTDVAGVESEPGCQPERMTLVLRPPCSLGREIIFAPPPRWSNWLGFRKHPLARELEDRFRECRELSKKGSASTR